MTPAEERSFDIQEALDTIQAKIKQVIEADPKLGPYDVSEHVWEAFGDTSIGDQAQDALVSTIVNSSELSGTIGDLRDAYETINEGRGNILEAIETLEDI